MLYLTLSIFFLVLEALLNRDSFGGAERSSIKLNVFRFCVLLLIAVSACRATTIGIDTMMYESIFNAASYYSSIADYFSSYSYYEYCYYLVVFVVSRFADYRFFLFVIAFLSIGLIGFVVWRHSRYPFFSLAMFVLFGMFTFTMSGQRQSCALGMVFLAYHFAVERKPIPYVIAITIAAGFHSSAWLFAPFYLFSYVKMGKKEIAFCVAGIVLAYVFRAQLSTVASSFARLDYTALDAGGTRMYAFMLFIVVVGLFYSKHYQSKPEMRALFFSQVAAAMIWPVASFNPTWARMYFYYQWLLILLIPGIVVALKAIDQKSFLDSSVLVTVVTGVGCAFLATQVLPAGYHFEPYAFFW